MCIKKIVSVFLAAVLMASLCLFVTTPAASYSCYVGESEAAGKKYEKLSDAVINAKGATIRLLTDVSWGSGGERLDYYDAKFVLDGNGHTVKVGAKIYANTGSDITFKNVTLDFSDSSSRFSMQGTGKVTLSDKATIKNRKGKGQGGGVEVAGQSLLVMEKGSLITDCEAEWGGVYTVGNIDPAFALSLLGYLG